MPELPEVETIAQMLRLGMQGAPPLPGRTVQAVSLRWPRQVATPSAATFRRRMKGRRIEAVKRRGKYLLMPLDEGFLLIHLKMSGDLRMVPSSEPRHRFEHTVLHLDQEWDLRFSDARKFGKLFLVDYPERVTGKLGPEPLEPGFTAAVLGELLGRRHRALKPLLLDQTVVAGLGNIYTDEALHRARLHPLRISDTLDRAEIRRLRVGIQAALRQGLRHNGASIDWVYRGGDFQNHFRVYQRAGQPCPVCGTPIRRIVVGQRGTHYCPACQPECEP
jgi:formamidopyrimidine-DNA glycosylase